MFIRYKKRKTTSAGERAYAYLVENKYRKNGKTPRQKVKKYLGRVHFFDKTENEEPVQILKESSFQEIMLELIENELKARKFIKTGDIWERGEMYIDLAKRQIRNKRTGKSVCLAINEGLFADETLAKLLDFKPPEAREREIGKALGNAVVNAGISIKNDKFIELFQKIRENGIDNH